MSINRRSSERVKWIGVYFFLIALLSLSCGKQPTERHDSELRHDSLNVEAKNASREFSMSILPNQLGKIDFKNKFIGIIPRKLAENSQEQEIEFFAIDAPTFKFDEFTIENIKQLKLTPKRITSLEQLAGELNYAKPGFDNFTARKVETSVTGGKLTVKDLDTKTSVTCTCPCEVNFDGDQVKYSC